MAHRVRPEAIWDRSSLVIERAGSHSRRFLHRVERRLARARVPGLVVTLQSVRIGGSFAPAWPFVTIRPAHLGDVRAYVGARAIGIHLEVLNLAAVEPSWLKRSSAGLLGRGAWWSWSLPRAVAREEELRTFLTLVETTVQVTARSLAARVAPGGNVLPAERGTVLEQWH